jgi:fatty acid desaturase
MPASLPATIPACHCELAMPSQEKPSATQYDPTFLHARREAIVIFFVWLTCMVWSVSYCYLNGYLDNDASEFDAQSFSITLGMPTWVFWGIAVPWLLANVATTWFCFAFMQDDDLGTSPEELEAQRQAAEHARRAEETAR